MSTEADRPPRADALVERLFQAVLGTPMGQRTHLVGLFDAPGRRARHDFNDWARR